jgi:hypothetical protein
MIAQVVLGDYEFLLLIGGLIFVMGLVGYACGLADGIDFGKKREGK